MEDTVNCGTQLQFEEKADKDTNLECCFRVMDKNKWTVKKRKVWKCGYGDRCLEKAGIKWSDTVRNENVLQLYLLTSMNVVWIRNCRQKCYWTAGGGGRFWHMRRADTACELTRWQHFLREMTSWLPSWSWCQVENPTLSIDAYLLEEQSCQISSLSARQKRQSIRLSLKIISPTTTRTRTRWTTNCVVIWDQFLIQK